MLGLISYMYAVMKVARQVGLRVDSRWPCTLFRIKNVVGRDFEHDYVLSDRILVCTTVG